MICPWALKDEFLKTYHDEEWCRPHHDDTYLFEMLVLEGAQAGLSWSTILKRREGYRKTFFHFDISRCAGMTDEEMEEIGRTAPIIRNRRKINSVRQNARAVLAIQKSGAVFPVTSGILQKIKSLFIICRITMICLPVLLYQKK